MNLPSVGIAGEVRCVVTGVDGKVKSDTAYQKNLILNQGLDFFGGGKGGSINASCAIGAGNTTPVITQTKLEAFIALAGSTDVTSSYTYTDTGDGMYRMWEQRKYRFTDLNNINVSEVGLVSTGSTSANYYLTTRALIKDIAGNPTSISVKAGETLDIYYKVHKVIDINDKAFVINVLDSEGGAIPYNVVVRPAGVGGTYWSGIVSPINKPTDIFYSTQDLTAITTYPSISSLGAPSTELASYIPGSHKTTITYQFSLDAANTSIRTIFSIDRLKLILFQMRFGRVSDDAPLTKTNKETLTIPLEFSWGRYEGAL